MEHYGPARPPLSVKEPLLFLTSTTGCAPSGRNVRVKARVQHALKHTPIKHHNEGAFSEFSVSTTTTSADVRKRNESLHRAKARKRRRLPGSDDSQALVCKPQLSTRPAVLFDTSAVLALACFHVSRTGIDILRRRPDRMADILRWRQWTRTSFMPASTSRESPCTHSAIACLAVKLEDLLHSQWGDGGNSPRVLTCYSRSLAELRCALGSLCDGKAVDVVAAAQLLAVFEMLDSPESDTWTKHTTGAVALLMSSQTTGTVPDDVCRPILVEALLDSGKGPYAQAPRQVLARRALPACTRQQNGSLDSRLSALVQQTAELIDRWHSTTKSNTLNFGASFALLAEAHELRSSLRNLATIARTDEGTWLDGQGFDYLGFGLTCMVALDQMILALRPEGPRPMRDVEEDTYEICTQMLREEMRCNEHEPRWGWRK